MMLPTSLSDPMIAAMPISSYSPLRSIFTLAEIGNVGVEEQDQPEPVGKQNQIAAGGRCHAPRAGTGDDRAQRGAGRRSGCPRRHHQHPSPDTGTSVSTWDKVAQCESGGNWATSTGNGFHGGLQFTASTWRSFGGSGMPHQASRTEQIAVAERVLDAQGWKAWPACSRKLGLR